MSLTLSSGVAVVNCGFFTFALPGAQDPFARLHRKLCSREWEAAREEAAKIRDAYDDADVEQTLPKQMPMFYATLCASRALAQMAQTSDGATEEADSATTPTAEAGKTLELDPESCTNGASATPQSGIADCVDRIGGM